MSRKLLKEKLQDIKDSVIPRKLGYYKIVPSPSLKEKLPESQRVAVCFAPVQNEQQEQVDTLDFCADKIKYVQRSMPQYKGLIYAHQPTFVGDVRQAMQLYADEYKMPICWVYLNEIEVINPKTAKQKEKQVEI